MNKKQLSFVAAFMLSMGTYADTISTTHVDSSNNDLSGWTVFDNDPVGTQCC